MLLLGREKELAAALHFVQQGTSITIHGGPGIGKASFARALARRSSRRFVEVDLAAGEAIPNDAPALLLLGVDRCPPKLRDDLLGIDVPFIATSRWRSVCPSERSEMLAPLSTLDTAALFARESGHSVDADYVFAMTAGNPEAIICAAERSRITPLSVLDADLRRDAWCIPKLEEELARLDPTAGSFLRELSSIAPVAVVSASRSLGAERTERHLALLLDRHLLGVVDGSIVIPHMTQVILQRNERRGRGVTIPTLVAEAERRRSRFYLMTRSEDLRWLRSRKDELLEVLHEPHSPPAVAVRAALAVEPLLTTQGSMFENLIALDRAQDLADEADDSSLVAATAWAAGKAWLTRGCFQRSLESLDCTDRLAPGIDDVSIATHAYVAIAHARAALSDIDTANAYLTEAESWAAAAHLPYDRALARVQFAFVALRADRLDDTIAIAVDSLREAALGGLPRVGVLARYVQGMAMLAADHPAEANEQLRRAAAGFADMGETAHALHVWTVVARAEAALGRIDEALAVCRDAVAQARANGDDERELWSLVTLAELALADRRFALARQVLDDAQTMTWKVGTPILLDRIEAVGSQLSTTARPLKTKEVVLVDRAARHLTRGGKRTSLLRRAAIRRILQCLIDAAETNPDVPVSAETLFEAGWPGALRPDNARNKVYTALWTLRRIGLQDALATFDQGYALDSSRVRFEG